MDVSKFDSRAGRELGKPDLDRCGAGSSRWAHKALGLLEACLQPCKRRRWLVLVGLAGLGLYELHTSALQSWLLSHYAKAISYQLEPGISPRIVFPIDGPFDQQRGYTRLGLTAPRAGGCGGGGNGPARGRSFCPA